MIIRLILKRLGWASLMAISLMVAVFSNPGFAFAYSHNYGGFAVRSDRPIDPAIDRVLDDTIRRLKTSPFYYEGEEFRVFICNYNWRLGLFALNRSIGGGTVYGTRNIFLRQADISSNRIVSPSGGSLLDEKDRPMSYFIAHEATHVMDLRRYGEIAMLRSPFWLVEGHADLVGKAGSFDIAANRDLLERNDRLLSEKIARQGLYRLYHLMVASLLRRPNTTIDSLFAAPPSEPDALREAGSS